jgi:DNA-binding transcriptional ArsR family regulator
MLRDYGIVLKAAADPNRARILKMLERGEMCVCQIAAVLRLSQSTVSKHLYLLRAAGLVEERKDGRWLYCRIAGSPVNDYALPLLSLIRGWLAGDATMLADAGRAAKIRQIPVEQLCSLDPQEISAEEPATMSPGNGGERV